jgi:phage shock protein PspC (stress-responsive transcriptional regulator)
MNTTTDDPQTTPDTSPGRKQLRRSTQDRMLGGVAAGLADYLNVDVTLVRVVIAVLSVMGGTGVPVYIAGWLLIPEEGTDQSIAASFLQSHQH